MAKVIPIRTLEKLRKKADSDLARREARENAARRKLMPVMVAACEELGVTAEDILVDNRHPDVVIAREVVFWLGYTRSKIGTTTLCKIMNRDRTASGQLIKRVREKLANPKQDKLRAALKRVELRLESKP